jgi:hypothetical protein
VNSHSPAKAGILAAMLFLPAIAGAAQSDCPRASRIGSVRVIEFEDGSLAMRTALEVNTDGAKTSYMEKDQGINYVANGIARWVNGKRIECSAEEGPRCRRDFLKAEAKNFAVGTDEFCAFGLEVETSEGRDPTSCGDGFVFGNSKGAPRIGGTLETVTGELRTFFVSTTSAKHRKSGKAEYLDALTVPALVAPREREQDLGRVAWVFSPSSKREAVAVVGDIGPRFGEGSVALHQLLHTGALTAQKPGPIPVAERCQGSELELGPPYKSKPDKTGDVCRHGQSVRGDTDIRAKIALASVDVVILGNAKLPMRGKVIETEVTTQALRERLDTANYTSQQIRSMAKCLDQL